jgi:hypothetical protein
MRIRSREMWRHARAALLATAALLALALPGGASAAVEVPPFLWQSPVDGLSGSGAGQLAGPNGIAADPDSGHLYVSDFGNNRISEFDAWGQFVKAWGWGVADGAEELQTCGPMATPPTADCLPGTTGSGAGQFSASGPYGIAIDPAGDIYALDRDNFRVQKFDSDGNFLLAFGDEVNETTGGDVCTADSGHVCGQGAQGEGDGQLTWMNGNYLAVGPAGTVFVGQPKGAIQAFEADGSFKEKIVLEDELDGREVTSLAIDAAGNFYVVAEPDREHIYKFDPSGALLMTIDADFGVEIIPAPELEEPPYIQDVNLQPASPLAVDAAGNLYAVASWTPFFTAELVRFDPSGKATIPAGSEFARASGPNLGYLGIATNPVTGGGETGVYVAATNGGTPSFVAAYGPPPDKWAPPVAAPVIGEQYAVSADPDAATVRATINPQFWADTSYRVEYGTGKCSEGGCPLLTPEAQLGAGVTSAFRRTPQVVLPDLEPETTYRFRFVAQSSGGGPVHGVAPEGGEASASEGLEGSFTTPARPAPPPATDPCPNALFRSGASAFLPDCRAYEMVSPVDKDGGDVFHLFNSYSEPIHLNQSTPGGEKLTYSAARAFGDVKSSPAVAQYMASRGPEGWDTEAISPPRGTPYQLAGTTLETQYRAFSEDLCQGWLFHDTDPPLSAEAVTGFPNLYRTGLCEGEQTYEALTRVAPAGVQPKGYSPTAQGASADGSVFVFKANGQLEVDAGPKAAAGDRFQCYQRAEGKLRLVSVLPSGLANPSSCSVGLGSLPFANPYLSNLDNAVSEDGSRIYWSASNIGAGPGRLYLRIDGKNPTLAVSAEGETLSGITDESRFLAATPDGSKAIYSVGEPNVGADLYEYDLATQASTLVAENVRGVIGASEDLSRVYLVSHDALAAGASPGEENLYLYERGIGFRFVGALSAYDSIAETQARPLATSLRPRLRGSRVSDDGSVAVFISAAPLSGYDNTDAESGQADTEVFRYDAEADGGAGRLDCVSCNPSGVRPSGAFAGLHHSTRFWVAAQIPGWETSLHPSRVLSEDGSRLFFESLEALVPRDTNAKRDVYEWQQPGTGGCTASSASYSSPNGGCLSLISSGKSPENSFFVEASANGDDVFIATSSSLLPQDPGLIDIYDARVGGGFPQPAQLAPCQGEACQGAAQNPADVTPGSASFVGPPDPVAKQRARRCPKGKRRVRRGGKTRCVPRKANPRKTSKRGRARR